MACALTQGYVTDCKDSAGGILELKITEVASVDSFTVTAGVITAVANATGAQWWKYKPAKDTAYGKATPNVNVQNGSKFFQQEVSMAINKMQTNMRLELDKMAQNVVYIAVADQNGKYWLYGKQNGLDVSGGETGTGTARGDRNGYVFTFAGAEPEDAIEIDAATYATLETPGV